MSPKYILLGGYPSRASDGGKAFLEEFINGFEESVKILDCVFARPQGEWEEKVTEDREFFKTHLTGKKFKIELAQPEKFIDQVKWANAIYFCGGRTSQLKKILAESPGWERELEGKTIAGTSAGANMIAKYYYGLDGLRIGKGLGLLPIKVLVHYRSDYNAPNIDWNKTYAELKNHKEDLPLLTLAEGQFEVIMSQ